jgi:superfamily II DNA or RNA helicase
LEGPNPVNLRGYQYLACAEARVAIHAGYKRVLIVMATGLGKTEVFVSFADRWTAGRVLVVAPRVDLVGQAAKKIYKRTGEWPEIEQAEQRANETSQFRSRFIVACQQTLVGGRYRRLRDIGLVVIDEAHLGMTPAVKEMIDYYVSLGAVVLGFTATPLPGKMANIWEVCPFQMGIAEGISEGWLCPARVQCLQLKTLDLSVIKPTGGRDFSQERLAEVMGQDRVVYEVADCVARESVGLKTAVFCTQVSDARAVAYLLADQYGLKADWVAADVRRCPKKQRHDVMQSFVEEPDGVQIVCNVGCLTTGWDFPQLQHIVNACPTMSLVKFSQIFGRGTRCLEGVVDFEGSTAATRRAAIVASGKPNFKFTDLRDVALEHKLISVVDVLGGKLSPLSRGRAIKELGEGEAREVDEAMLERLRAQEAAEAERERERLAAVAAKAEYTRLEVDPFNPYAKSKGGKAKKENHGPVFPWGKYKRRPIKFVRSDYLHWFVKNITFTPKNEYLRVAVLAELESRRVNNRVVRGERFG